MAIRAEGTLKQVIDHANRIERRTNIKGTVSLSPNTTQTVVTVLQAGFDACAILSPMTASATAELASGGCFVSTYGAGNFTITHRNLAQADRTFRYMVAVWQPSSIAVLASKKFYSITSNAATCCSKRSLSAMVG